MDICSFQLRKGSTCLIETQDWEQPYHFCHRGHERTFSPCSRKWFECGTDRWLYAATTVGFGRKTSFVLMLHHVVVGRPPTGMVTDHINGNRFDNRRENLRFCTNAENLQNMTPRKRGASKYKGVYFNRDTKKWRAQIGCKGSRIRIGEYATEVEAAEAYNLKARQLFGSFAALNHIPTPFLNIATHQLNLFAEQA